MQTQLNVSVPCTNDNLWHFYTALFLLQNVLTDSSFFLTIAFLICTLSLTLYNSNHSLSKEYSCSKRGNSTLVD
mgnify:CR=1 FL=1